MAVLFLSLFHMGIVDSQAPFTGSSAATSGRFDKFTRWLKDNGFPGHLLTFAFDLKEGNGVTAVRDIKVLGRCAAGFFGKIMTPEPNALLDRKES